MPNPLTLTHCGRPGLTIEVAPKGDGWAWQVKIGMVEISEDGCKDEAAAMTAGRHCATLLLEQWVAELAEP